jgi:hypothetical protein
MHTNTSSKSRTLGQRRSNNVGVSLIEGYITLFLLLFLLLLLHHGVDAAKSKTKPKRDDFLVQGLEKIVPAFGSFEGQMYAGPISTSLMSVRSSSAHSEKTKTNRGALMFWLYETTKPKVKDSLVIWLNGGPGCSSFGAGMLMENGPVTIPSAKAGSCCLGPSPPLLRNKYAWTQVTSMLYVEQPAGTGFSYGPQPRNEEDLSRNFYNFLQVSQETQQQISNTVCQGLQVSVACHDIE